MDTQANKTNNLQCNTCNLTFSTPKTLTNHLQNPSACNKEKEFQEKYSQYAIIVYGNLRYKCSCDKVFDRWKFNRHLEKKKPCIVDKEIKESVQENRNEDGTFICSICGQISKDRRDHMRHLNRVNKCYKNHKTEEKDGYTVVYKNDNKYKVTKNSINMLCKEENCYLREIDHGFCNNHK